MAPQTPLSMRQHVIYSIFVRNFSEEGTFQAVLPELERIQNLGVDTIWFLPIYPIGEVQRKGTLGSPYAIRDYRQVDPNYGTMEDFLTLVDAIHQRGMRVMIDIVFNHTAPDATFVESHPEWYYRTPEGEFGNRVGDWTDIIYLDHSQSGLTQELIETLQFWAQYVDGFRCDVAPLIPIEFWIQARQAVETVNPDLIWLSESVQPSFLYHLRREGLIAHSDSEMYQAFDMTYDYDVRDTFVDYLEGKVSLSTYIDLLNRQETNYPANYVKLRNLENHDNPRSRALIPDLDRLKQWTAFNYMVKGAVLLYNGQETRTADPISLFDKDTIDWDWSENQSDYLADLAHIHRDLPLSHAQRIEVDEATQTIIVRYEQGEHITAMGIFHVGEKQGTTRIPLQDGQYTNRITGEAIEIRNHQMDVSLTPVIFNLN